ncbi:MAG: hypothetical protein U0930_03030 [Pirellulales bacterium]
MIRRTIDVVRMLAIISACLLASSLAFGVQSPTESLPVPNPVQLEPRSTRKPPMDDAELANSSLSSALEKGAATTPGPINIDQFGNTVLGHQRHEHHHHAGTAFIPFSETLPSNNPARIQFVLARNNQHYACPLRLLHIPYGAWIEIEGSYYQHKNFDNTMDVCVHFHLPHSVFPPTVIIKTASSPGEIRLSETSMSEIVQLVPGMTVEFDYAREFGDRMRKNPSKNELAHMTAYQSSMAYESRLQPAEQILTKQPDQISSINVETYPQAARLVWDGQARKYNSDPRYLYLFRLTGSEQLMKSIATQCYIKADIEATIKIGAQKIDTKNLKDVMIAGSLVNGRTLNVKRQAASFEVQADFFEAINSGSELSKFLVAFTYNCTIECQLTNIRIMPTNGTLDGMPVNSVPPITTTENSVLKLEVIVK